MRIGAAQIPVTTNVEDNLKNIKETNSELRDLSYHLYENNGVVKREDVSKYINKLKEGNYAYNSDGPRNVSIWNNSSC